MSDKTTQTSDKPLSDGRLEEIRGELDMLSEEVDNPLVDSGYQATRDLLAEVDRLRGVESESPEARFLRARRSLIPWWRRWLTATPREILYSFRRLIGK